MNKETNPYLIPENYLDEFYTNLRVAQDKANIKPLDKLCFDVFKKSESGVELLTIFKEKFLTSRVNSKIGDNYHFACIYHEGYRDAFRYIIGLCESYEKRKKFEAELNN